MLLILQDEIVDNINDIPSEDDEFVDDGNISEELHTPMESQKSPDIDEQQSTEVEQIENITDNQVDIQVPGTSNDETIRRSVVKENVSVKASAPKWKKN